MEELLEIITLRHLGYHDKPIVLLDDQDYYRPLLDMLERSIEQGFSRPELRDMYYIATSVADALHHIRAHHARHPAKPPLPPADEAIEELAEPDL